MYGYALSRGIGQGNCVAELTKVLGLHAADIESTIQQLLKMGLLRELPNQEIAAVPPEEAVSRLVGPLEREVRARRTRIEETRSLLMSFLPVFEVSLAARQQPRPFELLEELSVVRAAIAELAAAAQEEILTAQPGGARQESILEEAAPRDEAALARGVRMRILYQHTARFSLGTTAYVERAQNGGAQVRTLDDYFPRFLIFDRKTAVLTVLGHPQAALLVREPNVVAFMIEMYERMWLTGDPYTADHGRRSEISDDLKQAIVRLLVKGMTDASIATRLGMSVRTCRRHIADLMTELGAQSRFQAGHLLAARETNPESRVECDL
ncbi:helix-turn-helix transcriptional regulator [Streptomyces halobius]|uniref:Helix-turn-helix transcriptional regulator n=1 Tax=Streptomyces halobius TaxID=2879846 RepID=A0ABY4ME46_9ACTN|nr:helix-turn-helix transcriptional regulator [Streptomyces halobius]UQA95677.1 helix-turn-helix transcriptional regulator [Streptomyces halobius]